MALSSNTDRRLAAALVIAVAALSYAAPDRVSAQARHAHVAIVLMPGPPAGNQGPSMIKRLSYRRQLALGFMSATQGAYRPSQVLLDISAGSRVALSLYDRELPPGIALEREHGGGRIAHWQAILDRADEAPADIVPGTLAGAARARGRSVGYVSGSAGRNRDAIAAAGYGGEVAPLSAGRASRLAGVLVRQWRTLDVVVAGVPGGDGGYRIVDDLVAARRPDDVLVVIQKPPAPARRLLAIAAAGLGGGSALTSESTRRAGLVTSIDIAPTVLDRIDVPLPDTIQGQPITASADRSVKQISSLRGRITQIGPRRWKVTLGGLALALALILALTLPGRPGWLRRTGRAAFCAPLWLPAVLLATGPFSTSRLGEMTLIGVACALLALASERLIAWPRTPLVPAAVTVLAHIVDLAFGSGLIARSLLGPNPILGARFYGIGNELEITLAVISLMGIGAAVAAAPARTRVWTFALVGGTLTLLLSWGRLGADVGASLTFGAGVAAAAVGSIEGASLRKRLAIVLAAPALALGLLAAIDLVSGGNSHFTRSVLEAGGLHSLGEVFQRKLESSYDSLVRGIVWLLALAAVGALIAGVRWRHRLLGPLAPFPGLRWGLYGALTAVVVGTLTNDSGPVILLIGTVYLAFAVGYVQSVPKEAGVARQPPPSRSRSPV